MKTIVNSCGNCPFLYSSYDDYAVGFSTIDECTLAKFLNKEYYISIHNNRGSDSDSETPEWCPLKEEEFSFKFEELSPEKKQEIQNITKEIDEINEYFELLLEPEEFETPESTEKNERLDQLYNKLEEIQKDNREPEISKNEYVDQNLVNQLQDIKKELVAIGDAGVKLHEALLNTLGKNENH